MKLHKTKEITALALILSLMLPLPALHAQETPTAKQPVSTSEIGAKVPKGGLLDTAREIAVYGSVDGKRLFFVLGINKTAEITREAWKDGFITEKDLKDEKRHLNKAAEHIYNEEHEGDVTDWVKKGANETKEAAEETVDLAKNTFIKPWKSLQKIPGAVKVDLEHGSKAYHSAKNSVIGSAKFAAWSVVALLHGSYYLVIEAPARMILNAAGTGIVGAATVLIEPVVVTGLIVRSTIDGVKIAWIPVRIVIRNVAKGIAVATIWSASAVTVGVTELAIFTVAGVTEVIHGVKFLVQLPSHSKYPIQATVLTEAPYDGVGDAAAKIEAFLKDETQSQLKKAVVVSKIEKYSARLDVIAEVDGKTLNVARIKLGTKNAKVTVTLMYTRDLFNAIRGGTQSRRDVRRQLKESAAAMLAKIQAVVVPLGVSPLPPSSEDKDGSGDRL